MVMSSFRELATYLTARLTPAVETLTATRIKDFGKMASQLLTYKTPIDTGAAMSNWRVQTGANFTFKAPIQARTPGKKGSTKNQNLGAAVRVAWNSVDKFKTPMSNSIFIYNTISYISELDQGKSPQASAGFIHETLVNSIRFLPSARLKV